MENKLLFLLIFSFLLYCCQNKKSNDNTENKTETENIVIIDNYDNDWQKDYEGCLNLRTLQYAKILIEDNNLLGKSTNEFINVFGKPNKIEEYDNKVYLIYFMHSVCEEGKKVEGADECWVDFYFENDKLTEIPNGVCIQ